jgi:hypothetical protein
MDIRFASIPPVATSRPARASFPLVACVVAACATHSGVPTATVPAPSISFAIVEPIPKISARPGILRLDDESFTIREARRVRFATATRTQNDLGYPSVTLVIDPRDMGEFGRWTLANVGRTLAVVVDDEMMMHAEIHGGPLYSAMLFPKEPWSEEEADSFAARIHSGGTACAPSEAGSDPERPFALTEMYEPRPESALEILLERGPCFGKCPMYTLRICGDGSLSYVGKKYVLAAGERDATVTERTIRSLLARFAAVDFFSLPDRTSAKDSDSQSIVLTLSVNGESKRIEHLYGGGEWGDDPDAVVCEILDALSDALDYETGSQRWTGP